MARKPSKPSMKPRRRGLGVAHLEQLRTSQSQLNHPLPNPFQHPQVMVHSTGAFQDGAGYVLGAPDYTRVLRAGSNSETSNELSSVPKLIPHYHCPPFHACCEGAEVVTVHRKLDARGPKIFMEYEFFPEKDKEETMVASQISEASSSLATSTPNSVDLSLKLSL